jgi:hypothetical protein
MLTKIIALFLIFYFTFVTLATAFAALFLRKTGLLSLLMKYKWPLALLTLAFTVLFYVGSIGLWRGAAWAAPLLTYTLYGWLVYLWLYNLSILMKWVALLKWENARRFSDFMGRSAFFDALIHRLIALSNRSASQPAEEEAAHAVSDSNFEAVLNDEDLFREAFPDAIRKKIRRKLIGLLVHTFVFVLILLAIR